MKINKTNKMDLGRDSITKIFWTYAIPSILAMLAQTTAGLIDSIFIGRFVGPEGLSAITLVMPFIMILIGIAVMVGIGGTTLAGIELGKKNYNESNNYFNVTTLLLSIFAIVSTLVILLFIDDAASLTGATGLTKSYLIDYSSTISYFLLFFLLNFTFSFFLKIDSKPILVVLITLSGTLLNIFLDYFLIVKFNMAMTGAALATGLSQLIPWLLFLIVILKKSIWKFKWPKLKLHEIWRIVFNGSSEFLNNIAGSIASIVFNYIIMARIGIYGIAAYAVAMQVANIASSINYGFAESNQASISYNFGAGMLKRVSKFLKLTLTTNFITGVLLCILSLLYGDTIIKVFVDDQTTHALAITILRFHSFAFIIRGVNITIGTYYTAIDDPIRSAGIMLFRSVFAFAAGIIVLPILMGDNGIWASVVFAEVTTFILAILLISRKPFGSRKTIESYANETVLKHSA